MPAPIRAIAWKAQVRLCGRFRRLAARGKKSQVMVTAIARELAGFIWAVSRGGTRVDLGENSKTSLAATFERR